MHIFKNSFQLKDFPGHKSIYYILIDLNMSALGTQTFFLLSCC